MDKKELAEYVEKLKLGDISAFEVIYNETNNQVYNLLYSYTKNEYTSFDLMQETYLTVNSKIGTIKDSQAVKSWINRIAINKANRFFEKNKKEILLSEEGKSLFETQLEEDEEFLPQEILDSKEKQKIIKDIIDNLPIEQKTSVYLYYFDELSLSEVAADMECSEGTVKSRLNYARKKIKVEVDTWEKKGTKLYGTGVPVLLLLLKKQLEIEKISLDKANILLKDILTSIGGNNVINTIPELAKSNYKLANKINVATNSTRAGLVIKLIVAGIITTVTAASVVFINKPSEINTSSVNNDSSEVSDSSKINTSSEIEKRDDSKRNYGNTINNLYKKNQVAEYNGYFYYSSENKKGLYKVKANGEDIEKLSDDTAAFINVYKDHIYYVSKTDGGYFYDLVQVDMDGVSNKTVIANETTSAFISNDKLKYSVHEFTDKNGRVYIKGKEKDLITGETSDINNNANTSRILGNNRFINTTRGIDKYISMGADIHIPSSNSATIDLISANDEYIIARVDNYGGKDSNNKTYEDSIYCIEFNGNSIKLGEVYMEEKKYGNAVLVGSKFYYWKWSTLICVDLKDNNLTTSLFTSEKLNSELFEFYGIIYTFANNSITPIYDTVNQKLLGEAIIEKETRDKNSDPKAKTDFVSQDKAKEVLLAADGNFINDNKKNGDILKYLGLGNSQQEKIMKEQWTIKPSSFAYYFSLGSDEGGTAVYYVNGENGDVYRFPGQGGISAYFVKDNKIVKEFPWKE